MNFSHLKIGVQLRTGFLIILFFSLLMGVLGWWHNHLVWTTTRDLYEHPLRVQVAIGRLHGDILEMNSLLKDMDQPVSAQTQEQQLRTLDEKDTDGRKQIQILREAYLGPQTDIDALSIAFDQWKGQRDRAIQKEAIGDVPGPDMIESRLNAISDYAQNRSEQFYTTGKDLKMKLQRRLIITFSLILIVSLLIYWLLLKGTRYPMEELHKITEAYRKGNWSLRSRNQAPNELGALARAFNELAEQIEQAMTVNKNTVNISGMMLREDNLAGFCRELIKMLTEYTQAQMGALYFLNEDETQFVHFESVGLSEQGRRPFGAKDAEGELGVALATRKIQRISKIPEDTRFVLRTLSGDMVPREIITIPVLNARKVIAILSLARIRSFDDLSVRLLNDIHHTLTARINGVLAHHRIRLFSEQLENQNHELEAQKNELSAQSRELSEQNTELMMQQRRLDESNQMKSQFLANMSHELRTPLNSVIALSGVLHRRLRDKIDPEEYGYLSVIERNGKNLLALINDILDLSRIEAGRSEVLADEFSMRSLIAEVTEMIRPQAEEKGIRLETVLPSEVTLIRTDREKCRHILQNLIGNAVKFTEEGSVEVLLETSGELMKVTVSDTGIGILEEQLSIIFDEFRQADGSSSRKYGGTGLGLAISKKYAEILRGSITVNSKIGKGSRFTLSLPLRGFEALPQPPRTKSAEACDPAPLDLTGKTILLVEDSEPAIIQIRDFLSGMGCQIEVAQNGTDALQKLQICRPDAVILDLMMPEVDGFEVLRQIRCQPSIPLLPVLILTAKHISKEELNFLRGNHIHQLIQKGNVSRDELLRAVREMVFPDFSRAAAAPATTCIPPGTRPRVLIAEDNADNMTTLRALLKDTCDILEASDGRKALTMAKEQSPDIILLDIALPKLDGFMVLKQLREQPETERIPVIAVTASAMKGNREEILSFGFDGYVSKPVDPDTLMKILTHILYGDERD